MKTAVLAEKPSVGRDIAKVLGCNNVTRTYIEGRDYIVTWAMGHLVELADPGAHDPIYKEWNLDHLPIIPERMKHKIIKRTRGQFSTVQSILKRSDVNNLVIATDAGREGELVARWIMRLVGYKGPFQRLWISSQTDKAITDGFKNLQPGHDFDNLMQAAECRAEADWLIGLNVTRALSCKYDTKLSAGRVQTPTLSMIKYRDEEIKTFIPKPYWLIDAEFEGFSTAWRDKSGNRIYKQERAEETASKLKGADAVVVSLTDKNHSVPPPLAYDLTSLQQDANRSLGYSAKQTLKTLQILYERHKIVTYPRTDSKHLTTDIQPTLKDRLKALSGTHWSKKTSELLDTDLNPGKRLFDNSKVSDHHAIIPTEQTVRLDNLAPEEKALWELIIKRFIAVLSPNYRYLKRSAEIDAVGQSLFVSTTKTIDNGWRAVDFRSVGDDDAEHGSGKIDSLEKGKKLKVKDASLRQKQTSPPPKHTEGSLLASMENPAVFITDKKLKESIKQGGLGTPATRAEIIEKLVSNHYIERANGSLSITPAGDEVLLLAPGQLKSPELTAEWELRLSLIADGSEKAGKFTADIRRKTEELVQSVKSGGNDFKQKDFSKKPCPLCGRMMMPMKDKKGRALHVCRSLSCGYEEEPENFHNAGKPSKKEKAVSRKLMKQFSDDSPDTFTLADMIKLKSSKQGRK
jgi:DNA topoisomerase-3